MTGINRVDEWFAAQPQEPAPDGGGDPRARQDFAPGALVERRNIVSIGISAFLFALAIGMSWRLLPAFAARSSSAHMLATLSCALLLALLGWVLVSAIVSARLANWANRFVANDSNLDPIAEEERARVRDSSLDMEFRPPFAFSRTMRRTMEISLQRGERG